MCDLLPGKVSLVGTRADMDGVLEEWSLLPTVEQRGLESPERTYFGGLAGRSFEQPLAPAVALMHHRYGRDPHVAASLQADLLARGIPVLAEPVFPVSIAGTPGAGTQGAGVPLVAVDQDALQEAEAAISVARCRGPRVAVIDTGDASAGSMLDFTGGLAGSATAEDLDGHGTAVADVIRMSSDQAQMEALRVVLGASDGSSYELLSGLTYALWSERFDVVNISLSMTATPGCASVLGQSMALVLGICQRANSKLPLIVAAAGNKPKQTFAYPAKLPGAIAVQAWDFHQMPADYNVDVPPAHSTGYATGGESDRPLGTYSMPGGGTKRMVGTSFAAAVATAHILCT